jgi:signal peptidase I
VILKRITGGNSFVELVVIVVIALGLAFAIQAFIVKPYRIPSESMEPTLDVGQRVLVNRLGNLFSSPHVGEIVVFHPPQGAVSSVNGQSCGVAVGPGQICSRPTGQEASVNFIKRIVAGPGDVISIQGGHVIRNGKPEPDGFTRPCASSDNCSYTTPIKIPAGYWFMMGDNRGQSDDSRYWGPIPKKWIIGGAFATYWPPGRIGFL